MSTEEEASISLPSIAFVAVLGFFIYRYFFTSNASSRPNSSTTSRNNLRFTPAQVDTVANMFPQLDRRDIMWDLQRNRGNVQATTERVLMGGRLETATTERVLMGGRLETAPPSFQPITQSPPSASTPVSLSSRANIEPDLISRYNLQERVGASEKGKGKEEPNHGWAASKDERQAMLRRRRDEMILAARRKMLEKDRAGAGDGVGLSAGS